MDIREFYTKRAKEYGFDGFADFLRRTVIDVQMSKIYEWSKEYAELMNRDNTVQDKFHTQCVSHMIYDSDWEMIQSAPHGIQYKHKKTGETKWMI